MNILADKIISGSISLQKIQKLSKEDRKIVISYLYELFKNSKKKSDKVKYSLIIVNLREIFSKKDYRSIKDSKLYQFTKNQKFSDS